MLNKLFRNRCIGVIVLSSSLSLFWVLFLWRTWKYPLISHGFNATIFALGAIALFAYWRGFNHFFNKKNLFWLIPVTLIAISFSIFENPFLKAINLFIFPLIFGLFYNYGFNLNRGQFLNLESIAHLLCRLPAFLTSLQKAAGSILSLFEIKNHSRNRKVAMRIFKGMILLALFSLIIIPLLSEIDNQFAAYFQLFTDFISELFSFNWWNDIWNRALVFIFLLILILSLLYGWDKKIALSHPKNVHRDDIVGGILLGGILLIYLIFLWSQLGQMWVKSLPFEFKETEYLVKSGFWQLFFLSALNALLFVIYYKKAGRSVQKLLTGFILASLFLVFSAAHRMILYVINYGLSYEKFFASYTVLYSLILFVWLLIASFKKQRYDLIKFMLFAFIWMYSIATIVPVERFIFSTNLRLAQNETIRIDTSQMTELSSDIMDLVKIRHWKEQDRWNEWIESQQININRKRFYEKNLSNLIYFRHEQK